MNFLILLLYLYIKTLPIKMFALRTKSCKNAISKKPSNLSDSLCKAKIMVAMFA